MVAENHGFNSHNGTEAETRLEYLLRQATNEPGRRPEFYRALLEADVWVLLDPNYAQTPGVLPAGAPVHIVEWCRDDGVYVLPFFSSISCVRQAEPSWSSCIKMRSRDLFERTRGQRLHLNPRCRYGREFAPHEADELLSIGVIANMSNEVLEEERLLQLEVVAETPNAMVEALRVLYRRIPAIKAAHLVYASDPAVAGRRTLLIAIEADRRDEVIMHDTGSVIRDTLSEPVDLMFIASTDDGIGQRIARSVQPFYERVETPH